MSVNSSGPEELSNIRRWIMRVPFFLTGVLFSITAWTTLIQYWGSFEPLEGVTYAFWGSLSLLALIGLRFPQKMLPLLHLQMLYKLVWILAVGLPLEMNGGLDEYGQELMTANMAGLIIDLIAIPWGYSYRTYMKSLFER